MAAEIEGKYDNKIMAGIGFFSAIPPFAPLAGFIGGIYTAYKSSSHDRAPKRAMKTILGGITGAVAGTIGAVLPPGISSMPVGLAMSTTKAIIDRGHDKERGKEIGAASYAQRIGGVLLGAIPVLGPVFSTRALEKASESHQRKNVHHREVSGESGRNPPYYPSTQNLTPGSTPTKTKVKHRVM